MYYFSLVSVRWTMSGSPPQRSLIVSNTRSLLIIDWMPFTFQLITFRCVSLLIVASWLLVASVLVSTFNFRLALIGVYVSYAFLQSFSAWVIIADHEVKDCLHKSQRPRIFYSVWIFKFCLFSSSLTICKQISITAQSLHFASMHSKHIHVRFYSVESQIVSQFSCPHFNESEPTIFISFILCFFLQRGP
jgi:hypothetical protein